MARPGIQPLRGAAKPERYRADIDGIRGIAVAAVVLFHVGVGAMHGGFVGVDIFFVISGYLISGIILRSLEKGTFSFAHFYVRRINRIVPALLIILLVAWLFGVLFAYAHEFHLLGRQVLGGSTFSANYVMWRDQDYWSAYDKPLLHLWSLAVEEQFYLLWPALLVVVWKAKRSVRWTLIAIIEISFVVNVWQVRHGEATAAFYLPGARFWEILSGSLWYHVESSNDWIAQKVREMSHRTCDVMSVVGALLIAITLVAAKPGDAWPGTLCLLPVAGTILLIAAGQEAVVNRVILSRSWIVYLGLISYPLYLWHWPLLVMGRVIFEKEPPGWLPFLIIPASLALAAATYRWIEKPIRFGAHKGRSAALLLPGLGATAVLGFIAVKGFIDPRLQISEGHAERWGASYVKPQGPVVSTIFGPPVYVIPGDSTRTVVLSGDSHMEQYWERARYVARGWKGQGPRVVLMVNIGCPVLPGTNAPGRKWKGDQFNCDKFNENVFEYASRPYVKTVVFSGYWESFVKDITLYPGAHLDNALGTDEPRTEKAFQLFESHLRSLVSAGKHVYIMLANPEAQLYFGSVPRRLAGLGSRELPPFAMRDHFILMTRWTSSRLRLAASRTGATIIDPAPYLCDSIVCAWETRDGESVYYDDHHLRSGFVKRNAVWLDQVFR